MLREVVRAWNHRNFKKHLMKLLKLSQVVNEGYFSRSRSMDGIERYIIREGDVDVGDWSAGVDERV